ncbi:MAG: prepilin-type N-terminal cleavage/methylation domain-containing protein [Candidatus Zapsychrus exili]|nr:prepilin-type N-terminal cleavage/methylation domain-containing protein [Candidatus Zapsychrus exili]
MNTRAFTLLEVMLAIIVLAIGIVSLISMLGISLRADIDVDKKTIAFYLAQEKLEEIKDAFSYANIDSFAFNRVSIGGDFSDFDREVVVSGDPKQVSTTVYWSDKSDELNINLVTLFADYDY